MQNAQAKEPTTLKTIITEAKAIPYINKPLKIEKGGGFLVSANTTLKILTPNAGRYQIFFGQGKIEFRNKGVVFPEWFGVKANSLNDSQPFFQKAVDAMALGGTLTIQSGNYYIRADKPTISNPKRILIKYNDITVEGIDTPTFVMKGVNEKYLRSIEDHNSSGRDLFSVFTWLLADNGIIKNIKIIGDYTGKSAFNFKSPRAKGIANIGSHNFTASQIQCFGVFGNCINITPASGIYDGKYRPVLKYHISDSNAEYCWENGFNAMGGTFNGFFINNRAAHNSSTGFEAATTELIVQDNILTNNKYAGMSISSVSATVSDNVITNNGPVSRYANSTTPLTYTTLAGAGIVLSFYESSEKPSRKIFVRNNIIKYNAGYGIMLYPKTSNISIEKNHFENNSTMNNNISHGDIPFNVPYASEVYIVGKETEFIKNINILKNKFLNNSPTVKYIININTARDIVVKENIYQLSNPSAYPVYFQNNCENCTALNNQVSHIKY